MMLPLVVVLLLLASVGTASAECAWVLWTGIAISADGRPYEHQGWSLMSAYTNDRDCTAKLDTLQTAADQRLAPTTLDRYIGYPKAKLTHVKCNAAPTPSTRAGRRALDDWIHRLQPASPHDGDIALDATPKTLAPLRDRFGDRRERGEGLFDRLTVVVDDTSRHQSRSAIASSLSSITSYSTRPPCLRSARFNATTTLGRSSGSFFASDATGLSRRPSTGVAA
jgi:hypothetical protein